MLVLKLVLMAASVSCLLAPLTPEVRVGQGRLRGAMGQMQNRFYNIPYAVAGRFQKPQEPPRWEGVFDAVNHGQKPMCPQWRKFFVFGNEDCLFLDVFSPEWATPDSKFPVMVYFHGGAYYMGAKNLYDPEFLVVKDLVVVTVNYRLGVLGFLCLKDVSNLGLRDQVAALKWVKKNIAAFGGDEDNVTVCGESAGASSAALHLFSESSKGLFHKAILMSGTALSTWAFNQEPKKPAFQDVCKIARVETEEELIQVFSKVPLDLLIQSTKDTSVNPRYFKYSPCVETNSGDPFFRDTPYNLLKSGNFNEVPVMMGYTESEGSYFYGLLDDAAVNNLNHNFEEMIPSVFSWCPSNRKHVAELLRSHYFGCENITIDLVDDLINFYSDWVTYATTSAFSKELTKFSSEPVYNYLFAYEGDREFAKTFIPTLRGPVHAGELFYIFRPFGLPLLLSAKDRQFIDRLTGMMANFMKYGKPTPRGDLVVWPAGNLTSSNTMVLDKKLFVTKQPYPRHSGDFFLKVLCKYGQQGYVPCDSEQVCLGG